MFCSSLPKPKAVVLGAFVGPVVVSLVKKVLYVVVVVVITPGPVVAFVDGRLVAEVFVRTGIVGDGLAVIFWGLSTVVVRGSRVEVALIVGTVGLALFEDGLVTAESGECVFKSCRLLVVAATDKLVVNGPTPTVITVLGMGVLCVAMVAL